MNTRNFLLLILITITQVIWAQVPQKMSYQAVIRNGEGHLIVNQQIQLKISIVKGTEDGTVVFEETHNVPTNSNGLVSIQIGGGEGNDRFSGINWADDIYFIKTETDAEGGTNYTLTSVNQILSVPYAMAAKTAESLTNPIEEQDPNFTAWDKNYETLNNKPTTITAEQAGAINANSAKNSYPDADATKLSGIEAGAQANVQADWNATSGDAMILNKPNIPDTKDLAQQTALEDSASAIRTDMFSGSYNDLSQKPTTITSAQAQAITANSAKNSYPDADATKLSGIEAGAQANVKADWNATEGDAMILNKPNIPDTKDLAQQTALEDSAAAIRTNMFSGSYNDLSQKPTTITTAQAQAITANSAKNTYPTADATKLGGIETGAQVNVQADWNATEGDAQILNKPTTITTAQAQAITANSAKNTYPTNDATKLSGIETGAQVNVQADWNATEGDAQILNKPNLANTVQVSSPAQGDLAYYNGTQWQRIAKGTNGQVLKMDNNAPAWNDENQSNTGLPTPDATNKNQFLMSDGSDYVVDPTIVKQSDGSIKIKDKLYVEDNIKISDENMVVHSVTTFKTTTQVDGEARFYGNIIQDKSKALYFSNPMHTNTDGSWKIVVEDGDPGDSSKLVFYVHIY
jgi:Cu/Ag efflux protein CusF